MIITSQSQNWDHRFSVLSLNAFDEMICFKFLARKPTKTTARRRQPKARSPT